MNPTIGFAGMTHLGLNSAVAAAEKGFNVVGFDLSVSLISELNEGQLPVSEPQLDTMLKSNQMRLHFTAKIEELCQCDLVYIAPDVPTDHTGKSDLTALTDLIKHIDQALPTEAIIVLLSQVPPGFSRKLRLKDGRIHFYQVETLIFGQAIVRALYPERIIIGTDEPQRALPEAYASFLLRFDCPILSMRFESAELCKISINCCLVASVSVANTLAEICEHNGADWSEIAPALKLDKRIGSHAYLSPGLGISGGNLERDLNTVIELSKQYGTDASVVSAWIHNSIHRKNWPFETLIKHKNSGQPLVLAVWGLAYKQDTHSTKNSPSIAFIREVIDAWPKESLRIQVYDPQVSAVELDGHHLQSTSSPELACQGADVLAILTPWTHFKTFSTACIRNHMTGNLVVDPYRMLSVEDARQAGLQQISLGTLSESI